MLHKTDLNKTINHWIIKLKKNFKFYRKHELEIKSNK